ncbi:MAG: SGNH/GDSL hydrolase family protein [Lachnospiraceae bacterium]|nr:SGNH/GDSL hydrolase family protein [Lachnospiraceae bacterium]
MMDEFYLERGIKNIGNVSRFQTVFQKAEMGKPITVGFIGGSITMGSLSSTPETCYAYLVKQWFEKTFPGSKITYVNAGIGATTSQFGVARVQEDLLSYKPDLVIAEFSVNDKPEELFEETFEGLIRTILYASFEPALMMFENVEYDTGNNAAAVHDKVGFYYDLPMGDIKSSIYQAILDGRIERGKITPDNLHPNDLGHSFVAKVLIHLLEKIKEDHQIYEEIIKKEPLSKNEYEHSIRYNSQNAEPSLTGFIKDESTSYGITDVFKHGYIGKKTGDVLSLIVTAKHIAIQYRKSIVKPAPIAKAVIDGKEEDAAILDANFEETWGDCLYLQNVFDGEKEETHTITITIISADHTESDFYLASIITA